MSKQPHFFATLFAVGAALLLFITSCDKPNTVFNGTKIEPCASKICQNGGTCFDGICQCPTGFEGAACELKWNEKYSGAYIGTNSCTSGLTYPVQATPVVNQANAIALNGVQSFGTTLNLFGTLQPDRTTINFATQYAGGDLYISGIGTQSESKEVINCWLVARDSAAHTSTNCSIVLDKQ